MKSTFSFLSFLAFARSVFFEPLVKSSLIATSGASAETPRTL
jgi:hypothetical protein